MKKSHILIFLSLFLSSLASGQVSLDDESFPRIFGSEKDYNGITLTVVDNSTIKYSRENCSIKCLNNKGKEKWTADLSKLKCDLIYFAKLPKDRIKKCDIIFQLKDKRIFVLKSRNGKIKVVSAEQFDKLLFKKYTDNSISVPVER